MRTDDSTFAEIARELGGQLGLNGRGYENCPPSGGCLRAILGAFQQTRTRMRNYQLLAQLSQLSNEILVGVDEVAHLTGLAARTIQQRRLPQFPSPVPGIRRLRWRLGDIRAWISRVETAPTPARLAETGSPLRRRFPREPR